MAEQLTFELAAPEPASFANFVAGPNREAVTVLQRAAAGAAAETGVVLWGAGGAGKTHLLLATVRAARAAGRAARYFATPDDAVGALPDGVVAVDLIDTASPAAQGALFTLYNALRDQGGQLVAAGALPPARAPLRDDLRTRLGWGLVFEVRPLADADKPAALNVYARERGFQLSDEVIAYLLAHGRRDMPSLVATLAALDRHSLAVKRPVTIPLLRAWMQGEMGI